MVLPLIRVHIKLHSRQLAQKLCVFANTETAFLCMWSTVSAKETFLHDSQSPENLTHSPVFKALWAAVLLNLLRTGTLQKTFLLGGLKQDKQVVTVPA